MQRKRLGWIAIALALLPLSNGARHYAALTPFLDTAVSARATVVRLESQQGGSGTNDTLFPVVRFIDDNGNPAEARTNVGKYPAAYQVGDALNVLHDPDNPADVREDSFTGLYFESAFFLIPGLITLLAGLLLVYWPGKRRH